MNANGAVAAEDAREADRILDKMVNLEPHFVCRRVVKLDLPGLQWDEAANGLGLDLVAALSIDAQPGNRFSFDVLRATALYSDLLRSQGAPVSWLGAVTAALGVLQSEGSEPIFRDGVAAAQLLASKLGPWPVFSIGETPGDVTPPIAEDLASFGSDPRVSWKPTPDQPDQPPGRLSGLLPDLPPVQPLSTGGGLRLQEFLGALSRGIFLCPRVRWSGELDLLPVLVNVPQDPPSPALFLVERYAVSFVPRDYGRGRAIATITLLPAESTHVRLVSWRTIAPMSGSNVIDSLGPVAADRFDRALEIRVADETTRVVAQYEPDLVTQGGFGALLHMHGGVSFDAPLSLHAGREDYVRQIQRTLVEHVAASNAHRAIWLTGGVNKRPGVVESEVRAIGNVNMRKTLSFTFHELNQSYLARIYLTDVRIGFSNGRLKSWRESSVTRLRPFLQYLLQNGDAATGAVLPLIGAAINDQDTGRHALEYVVLQPDGTDWDAVDADQGAYRIPGEFSGYRYETEPTLMQEEHVVLRTDSAVAEPMLGRADALDSYALGLQDVDLAERRADVSQMVLLNDALVAIPDGEERAAAYAKALRPDGAVRVELDQTEP